MSERLTKISKASVNYRFSMSAAKQCGTCVMFEPAKRLGEISHCELVAGVIDAHSVCDRWKAKDV